MSEKSKFLFSVLGKEYKIHEVMKRILDFYFPNKNAKLLDPTCGYRIMYKEIEDRNIIFSDIRKIDGCLQYDCKELPFKNDSFDGIIFDPPYVNIKNRMVHKDKKSNDYAYNLMPTPHHLQALCERCNTEFRRLLKPTGILICKITDFHFKIKGKEKLYGHIDLIKWFNKFTLWDIIIYRFHKHFGQPIQNYKYKVPKVHTFFLIFRGR